MPRASIRPACKLTLNRWIRGEAARTTREVTAALEACAFDDAAAALYRFIWNVFCDWYLELAKPVLNGADEAAKAETRATAAWVLDVAPEAAASGQPLRHRGALAAARRVRPPREAMLITAAWPDLPEAWIDAEAAAEIGWLIELVSEIRSIRSEMNVPPRRAPADDLQRRGRPTQTRLSSYGGLARPWRGCPRSTPPRRPAGRGAVRGR